MHIKAFLIKFNIRYILKTVIWCLVFYLCFIRYNTFFYAYDSTPLYEADRIEIVTQLGNVVQLENTEMLLSKKDPNVVVLIKPWDIRAWTTPKETIFKIIFLQEGIEIDTIEVVRLSGADEVQSGHSLNGDAVVLKSGYRYFWHPMGNRFIDLHQEAELKDKF